MGEGLVGIWCTWTNNNYLVRSTCLIAAIAITGLILQVILFRHKELAYFGSNSIAVALLLTGGATGYDIWALAFSWSNNVNGIYTWFLLQCGLEGFSCLLLLITLPLVHYWREDWYDEENKGQENEVQIIQIQPMPGKSR